MRSLFETFFCRGKAVLSVLRAKAARREAPLLAVLLFLVPIWAYPCVPTQDGPVHLTNSLILKDYGRPDNRFQEFYWINRRPLPNWACFALLAGFSHVVPPLVAEKLLVSMYLVGFALSFRYFVGAAGNPSPWLVSAGFVLVFNRCFWLGFYNYCLSLVLYFLVVGLFLRCWEEFRWRQALILSALFALTFFTHLFGFVLAAGSCLWLSIALPGRRWGKYLLLVAALLPGLVLAEIFFQEARFHGSSGFGRLQEYLLDWLHGTGQWNKIKRDVFALNKEMFGVELHKTVFLAIGVGVLFGGYILAGVWKPETKIPGQAAKLRALVCLGLIITLMYFLLPNFLTIGKGGFWKTRLILLPPLLWLSCSRVTSVQYARFTLAAATLLLLSFQFGIVTSFVHRVNQDLAEITAGLSAVGKDRAILFSIHSRKEDNSAVNPLYHAGAYYCLKSQNINLSHPFATRLHSVVRLHPQIQDGRVRFEDYRRQSLVEVIVYWDMEEYSSPEGFQVIYQQGRLKILERTKK